MIGHRPGRLDTDDDLGKRGQSDSRYASTAPGINSTAEASVAYPNQAARRLTDSRRVVRAARRIHHIRGRNLLLPERRRVVIELDGKQHYSDDGLAAPKKYADMVREDRQLRLAGYEVYRFGGYELKDHGKAAEMLADLFGELLSVLFAD